jgi:hypothetical protein
MNVVDDDYDGKEEGRRCLVGLIVICHVHLRRTVFNRKTAIFSLLPIKQYLLFQPSNLHLFSVAYQTMPPQNNKWKSVGTNSDWSQQCSDCAPLAGTTTAHRWLKVNICTELDCIDM